MLPWSQRPVEANLFNPAYCALLLRHAVEGHHKTALRGLDYAAAFMVLPVVLHKATRELLPGTISTKLHFWAQRHHEVRIGFAKRMQDMVPVTKEALLFGMQHEVLKLNEKGALDSWAAPPKILRCGAGLRSRGMPEEGHVYRPLVCRCGYYGYRISCLGR